MRVDKKSEAGEIRFVLVDGTGQARVQAARPMRWWPR
jgi:3-dehydroquinate synthetase